MHPALKEIEHRPWPIPARGWDVAQEWRDLAFVHYRMPVDALEKMIPRGLKLETFGGDAWVGAVPFEMAGVALRLTYRWATLPTFPELNLRTYVTDGRTPGVWFFSLDADNWPTVFVGRRRYGLPYFGARMSMTRKEGWVRFTSQRRNEDVGFEGRYRGVGPVFYPKPGSLEHWLTERYCLYSVDGSGGLNRFEVHHPAWPVQMCEAEVSRCDLFVAAGLPQPKDAPLCHFSTGVKVVTYGRERLVSHR